MQDAQRALEAMLDAGQLRRAHMATVSELLNCFSSLLSGKGCIDMHRHGLTSAEECDSLGEESWPLIAVVEELDENADSGEEGEEFVLPIGAGANSCCFASSVFVILDTLCCYIALQRDLECAV